MKAFKRIILCARQYRANQLIIDTLQRVSDYLLNQGMPVGVDPETALELNTALPIIAPEKMHFNQDLLVVIGGDGSMLSAARLVIDTGVPLIGINRGRLGFLTDIPPDSFETQLNAVLNGEFVEEHRLLLQAEIFQNDKVIYTGHALNDVVIHRGQETHLVGLKVAINELTVCDYQADGLIIATPTGSTAYALSAGGPIMHPKLNAMVIVPMFSHTLSSRPVVVDANDTVKVRVSEEFASDLRLSCDGLPSVKVSNDAIILVKKYQKQLRILHPRDYHYYDTLRIKLGWQNNHHVA
jgi:NAD+ kinase